MSELNDERLRSIRVVVSDVDDTLTRHGKLELSAFEALWALRHAGVACALITGRPLGWAEVIARQWPVDLAIGENGAGYVAVDAHGLHRGFWDDAPTRQAKARELAALRARVAQALPEARVSDDAAARSCDLAWDVAERAQMPAAAQAELGALVRAAGMRFVVSSVHAHAIPGDWNKANGAQRAIVQRLGFDPLGDAGCFIGDSANDAEAFAGFALSVGVANVSDHVDALGTPPAFVTTAERGRGFAELVQRILNARRG